MQVSYSTDGINFSPLVGDFSELVHAWSDLLRVPGIQLGAVVVLGERVAFDPLDFFPDADGLVQQLNTAAAVALDDPRPLFERDPAVTPSHIAVVWNCLIRELRLTRAPDVITRAEAFRVGSDFAPVPIPLEERSDFEVQLAGDGSRFVPLCPEIEDEDGVEGDS